MGLLDKLRGTTPAALPAVEARYPAKSVLAAAMPLVGPDVVRVSSVQKRSTQEEWQREAWYFYDAVGEARGPMVWIANAVSQADVHATDIDPDTGKPTGPTEDPRAVAAAQLLLGGVSKRAGLLKTLALCWQVVGEAWVIVRPQGGGRPDLWLVMAGNKVHNKGDRWEYVDPFTGATVVLGAQDRLIRVWSPHPADQAKADSSMRPGAVICREIELSSQNIASRLVSRIAMNGLAAVADELDIPRGDYATSAESVMAQLLATAEAGVASPGTAAAQVPLLFNAPGELIASGGAFAHFDISTAFDAAVVELRQDGLRRLAATLDMPKDVAEGTQGEANHWSAWQVEESTYKIFIEPLLKALGDALTEYWFRPALMAMGMTAEQADRFELGWDTTSIVARPDDTENLRDLHDRLLISDEYMLAENGVPEDALPDEQERTRRFLEKVVVGAPTLLADPAVAQALGLDIEVSPVAAGVDAEVGAGGELEAPEPEPAPVRALPTTQSEEPQASDLPEGLVAAAELIVYDALSRAGGRLLTNQNRGQFKSTPKHELHTMIDCPGPLALLEGSFEFTDRVAVAFNRNGTLFNHQVRAYVENLLFHKRPHDREVLKRFLT